MSPNSIRALCLVALVLSRGRGGRGLSVPGVHLHHHLSHHLAAWTVAVGLMLARRRIAAMRARPLAGLVGWSGRLGRGRRLPVGVI